MFILCLVRRNVRHFESICWQSEVSVVQGVAQFVSSGVVEVNGEQYSANHILIATGGAPMMPSLPGSGTNFFSLNLITSFNEFMLSETRKTRLHSARAYLCQCHVRLTPWILVASTKSDLEFELNLRIDLDSSVRRIAAWMYLVNPVLASLISPSFTKSFSGLYENC